MVLLVVLCIFIGPQDIALGLLLKISSFAILYESRIQEAYLGRDEDEAFVPLF